jgi:two-component system chemotaxis sensor kinase CheA
VSLAKLLGLREREAGAMRNVVVLHAASEVSARGRVALGCGRLLGQRELVLRPVPVELRGLGLLHAVAVLPNGQALFVLSPDGIVDAAGVPGESGPTRPRGGAGGGPDTHARTRSVLVADDSITTRSLLRTVLEASGFRVRTAADGEEAARLALAEPFDLVVSDVQMPRLDGFRLTARLRAHPRSARVPIVLFSTLDSDEDRRRGVASGADAFLTKNAFDRGELLGIVKLLIEGTDEAAP